MIENILDCAEKTDYDFREFSPNNDPLEHLFPEWVKYYKLKYAIAKIIQPKSVLEVGVRYGYSAMTFLKAAPNAAYTGIDIDNEKFGGLKGAINWAKDITRDYKADFIVADSAQTQSFPGKFYDLIHIAAQQDGDGTYTYLEKALEKGRYILVDGYFWKKSNMLSSTHFLEKYKTFIEYALIIPGYSGELLIKTKPNAENMFAHYAAAYEALVNTYDSTYYMSDCGGYETFIKSNGTKITDHRLLAAMYLSRPNKSKRILDIGSGRGELAYALSRKALHVTGVDYSKDAVDIAQNTFPDAANLEFVQADILKFNPNEKFDVVLATDVVEHIEEEKLLLMFDKVNELLSEDGVFIVHTAPNKLKYIYEYSGKYEAAKKIGTYIPKNPRTYYEDIMHINEQTPATLNRGLKKTFKNVFLWTSSTPDILGDFGLVPNKKTLQINDSIFAVCSKKDIRQRDIRSLLTQEPLNLKSLDVEIAMEGILKDVVAEQVFSISVYIINKSGDDLTSLQPFPVHASYHWKNKNNAEGSVFEGRRTPLNMPLTVSDDTTIDLSIVAPEMPGEYFLELTMVQEGQIWFEQVVKNLPVTLSVNVWKD